MSHSGYVSANDFSILNQVASIDSLYKAWKKVRSNRGSAGVDSVSIRMFERGLDANLIELRRNLLSGTYEPLPARYVTVIKADGRQRELAILCVRDRVAQRAVLDIVEPMIEPEMLDCSYAFRPGRSVEMAVQRIVVARAQGRRWTLDADVEEFFPAISHGVLLDEFSARVRDTRVVSLIKQWLDAGALDGARPSSSWVGKWRNSLSGATIAVKDSVNGLIDGFVADRLGEDEDEYEVAEEFEFVRGAEPQRSDKSEKASRRKAVIRRILQDGVLLALVERAALRGALTAKLLGLGGAAVGLAVLGPPAIRKVREMLSPKAGTMIGSPLSPLLSNLYLHPFDAALTQQGQALVRYCDDFVILCASEHEANRAMEAAQLALKDRKLRLNAAKTRIVAPDQHFDFLGYHFMADGRVIAPRSSPEVVARRVAGFADQHIRTAADKVKGSAKSFSNKVKNSSRK